MKLYTAITPSHRRLYDEIFVPNLPKFFSLQTVNQKIKGNGYFCEDDYLLSLLQRTFYILQSIRSSSGEVIAWSDVDVLFGDLSEAELLHYMSQNDMAFSRLGLVENQVCFGFFVMRCTKQVEQFWVDVRNEVTRDARRYDQIVGHDLLASGKYPHTILQDTFFNHCMGECPQNFKLFHAACVKGVNEKLTLLRDVRERFLREK